MEDGKFPYGSEDVDSETSDELWNHFKGSPKEFVYLGPKRYFFLKRGEKYLSKIYDMEIRSDDVWIVTHFRSGTTLTQELIWKVAHDMDFDEQHELLALKFPFIEFPSFFTPEITEELIAAKPHHKDQILSFSDCVVDILAKNTSPRYIKSHLPLSLLSPKLVDTAKVIYVARDPRDVAVSCYYFYKMMIFFRYKGDFKTFWNIFLRGLIICLPFFEHVKEAWALRHHPNMLFMFYEDIVKDTPTAIRRVASFLNKQPTDEQVAKLADHLKIDNFRKNKTVNNEYLAKELGMIISNENNFIRKGKSGGWRDYFDDEMTKQAEEWIKENLKDTDLRFPSM